MRCLSGWNSEMNYRDIPKIVELITYYYDEALQEEA